LKIKKYFFFKEILEEFVGISDATQDSMDKRENFNECFKLQQMIEPSYELISDKNSNNRQLIKNGALKKISKKSGELLSRHLILVKKKQQHFKNDDTR
jgi:hypothetical protein